MTIVGIRPDFIRMSEIIKELDRTPDCKHILVHTGQHYSKQANDVFFDELGIREPDINLNIGSGTHAVQAAKVFEALDNTIDEQKPDVCVFLGDSNASIGAVVPSKRNILTVHIEGGMRSYDNSLPEEKNRRIIDSCSDLILVYTDFYRESLLLENIPDRKIKVVGNTIVEVLKNNLSKALAKDTLKRLGLKEKEYILSTIHRNVSVDDPGILKSIFKGLSEGAKEINLPVVISLWFRTVARIKEFGIEIPDNFKVIEPLGFLDFLNLEKNAKLIVSDSGTVCEEACWLHVPCIVPRLSIERQEVLWNKSSFLAGQDSEYIKKCMLKANKMKTGWDHSWMEKPNTAKQCVKHIMELKPSLSTLYDDTDERRLKSWFKYWEKAQDL